MKICRSCKHEVPLWGMDMSGAYFRVGDGHCKLGERSLVSGELKTTCEQARAEGGICGPEGKLWELYVLPKPWWRRLFLWPAL